MKYSVVIPVYNEEDSVCPLYLALREVMNNLRADYEIIFVNDSSRDKSLEYLKNITIDHSHLVIVNLLKHSGQTAALQAGFILAQGEIIITLDADLQNDPKDIPILLEKLSQGFDVVCGWRCQRDDPYPKIISSRVAGYIRRLVTREPVHDFGCTLRVFKRPVLDKVILSGNMHRFFTFIMYKLGYKITEVRVRHHPRMHGVSKYTIGNRLLPGLIDLIRFCSADVRGLAAVAPANIPMEVIKR